MNNLLDIRTISFTAGLVSVSLSIGMLYLYLSHKTYRGFFIWTVGAIVSGAGAVLLSARGYLPDFATIVVANTLILLFNILIVCGLRRFYDKKGKYWLDSGLLILFVGLFIFFTYYKPFIEARIIIICVYFVYYSLIACIEILKHQKEIRLNFLLTVLLLVFVWNIFRILSTSVGPKGMKTFMNAGLIHAIAFIVLISSQILKVIGLLLANHQRLEVDLTDAQTEITALSGIIPICSYCKNIRDDKGYWEQVEAYIVRHTQAQFTHGMCPDCSEQAYLEAGLEPPSKS